MLYLYKNIYTIYIYIYMYIYIYIYYDESFLELLKRK